MKTESTTFNSDDFEFSIGNKKLDLEKSVADLGLQNNSNIVCEYTPQKKFTLQFNDNGINEKQNKCIDILSIRSYKIQSYKNIKLKDLINNIICNFKLNENVFWGQVENGNLHIGGKAVKSNDYEKTVSEFLGWDSDDNRPNIQVNAVMQKVSLYDISERKFALQYDNELFSVVAFCPLETLSTVIERWCHKKNFRADKFIDLMNSDKVKLIVEECALGKEVLDLPIKDIKDINLNELELEVKLDPPDINLNDIKAKNFGMYFNVVNSEKEPYIRDLNETQTLKEIIEKVDCTLGDQLYYNNIVDQIEKNNLKIIDKNNKEYVFNKDDLEKPFYKIIGNINEFAVDGDKNLPIIRFQIPTLEINQTNNNLINPNNVNSNFYKIEGSSEIENKQKKSSWLFKLLISLAIIFAVLSILAFALELALALKIVFTCLATACLIGLIVYKVVNHYRQEKPYNSIKSPLLTDEDSIIKECLREKNAKDKYLDKNSVIRNNDNLDIL